MTAVNCVANHLLRLAPHVVYRLVEHAVFVGHDSAGIFAIPWALLKPRCSNCTSTLLGGLLLEEGLNWDVTPR